MEERDHSVKEPRLDTDSRLAPRPLRNPRESVSSLVLNWKLFQTLRGSGPCAHNCAPTRRISSRSSRLVMRLIPSHCSSDNNSSTDPHATCVISDHSLGFSLSFQSRLPDLVNGSAVLECLWGAEGGVALSLSKPLLHSFARRRHCYGVIGRYRQRPLGFCFNRTRQRLSLTALATGSCIASP